jgi:hypothetical protein
VKLRAARAWLVGVAALLASGPAPAFDIDLVLIEAGPVKADGAVVFQFEISIDGIDLGSEIGLVPPGSSGVCDPGASCAIPFDAVEGVHRRVFEFASQSALETAFPSGAGAYTLEFMNGVSASFTHSYQKLASSDSPTPGFTEITGIDPSLGGGGLLRTSANPEFTWANCATCSQATTLEFDLFDLDLPGNEEARTVFRDFEFAPPADGMAVFPDDVNAIFFPNGKPDGLTPGHDHFLEIDLQGLPGAAVILVDDRDGDYLYRQTYRHQSQAFFLVTPEPSAGLLAALGLLGLGALAHRRDATRAALSRARTARRVPVRPAR